MVVMYGEALMNVVSIVTIIASPCQVAASSIRRERSSGWEFRRRSSAG